MVQRGEPGSTNAALPVQLSRLYGRKEATGELCKLVAHDRLVTLVGPPGCGKTRLGVEVASGLGERFPAGTWFVDLAASPGPAPVATTVAATLGIRIEHGVDAADTLASRLGGTDPRLLILDNCEHVVDAAAVLAKHLVDACPAVHVLATSRVRLGLAGERVWNVPPLETGPATALFVDRAVLADRGFDVDAAGMVVVREICERLDGLPLAVELTAAWIRVLSVDQIASRLDHALALLVGTDPARAPRHTTMSDTVAWTCGLLPAEAQDLFQRLSVFVGGFDLEAAQAVAVPGSDVLTGLAALVDHSLVVAQGSRGPRRFRMLEPVRQCGAAALARDGDMEETVRLLHAEHYLAFARRCDPFGLGGFPKAHPIPLLQMEQGNLLAALTWARDRTDPPDLGLSLAEASAPLWEFQGSFDDGRTWLEDMLAAAGPATDRYLRAAALARAGKLAWRQGDYGAARAFGDEGAELCREIGDEWWSASMGSLVALVAVSDGRATEAIRVEEASAAVFRRLGDEHSLAWALIVLGWAHYVRGDAAEGARQMSAALDAADAVGNPTTKAHALAGLSFGASLQGDLADQRTHLVEALRVVSDEEGGLHPSDWLGSAVTLAAGEGRIHAALRLAGRVAALGRYGGSSNLPVGIDDHVGRMRREVGRALADRLMADGAQMTVEQLTALAVAEPLDDEPDPLSPREREIAKLVSQGMTNVAIARTLSISRRTVETHVAHIRQKLGLASRQEIVAWVLRSSR